MPNKLAGPAPVALAVIAAFALVAETACGVRLDSPREFQVFQRETVTAGKVVVRAHLTQGCDAAEARIAARWQPLHVDRECRVDDTLAAPAGGWYRLEVRFRTAGRVTANASVAHVGVGEVFVISGQSNCTNFGFPWKVAQVSYHSPDEPYSAEIRAAQASLWKDGLALEGPDTDTLTGANRQDGGTGVHMSARGLQAHGEMWAEKVGQWISQR